MYEQQFVQRRVHCRNHSYFGTATFYMFDLFIFLIYMFDLFIFHFFFFCLVSICLPFIIVASYFVSLFFGCTKKVGWLGKRGLYLLGLGYLKEESTARMLAGRKKEITLTRTETS